MAKDTTSVTTGFSFGDTDSQGDENTNLLTKLRENLEKNSRAFSKVGGRTVSARQEFDRFINRQRKIINDSREERGLAKISQYDAVRQIAALEHKYFERDAYTFGDRLTDIVDATGRAQMPTIKSALAMLAEDWASDPRNTHCSFNELCKLSLEIASEQVEASILEA